MVVAPALSGCIALYALAALILLIILAAGAFPASDLFLALLVAVRLHAERPADVRHAPRSRLASAPRPPPPVQANPASA